VALSGKETSKEGPESGMTNSNAPSGQSGHQNEWKQTGGNCGQGENTCPSREGSWDAASAPSCHTDRQALNDMIFCVLLKKRNQKSLILIWHLQLSMLDTNSRCLRKKKPDIVAKQNMLAYCKPTPHVLRVWAKSTNGGPCITCLNTEKVKIKLTNC